ncbi:zinc ABC transporter ATP-binding protein AztA [Marisediminicola sp. LYQ134]|uniref:zinc ABC transporter ATP-binding protein AztA n=1 Tax=Marisediminicola sp. LYQ134 TaxID=3391061 RepID=UPI003983892C
MQSAESPPVDRTDDPPTDGGALGDRDAFHGLRAPCAPSDRATALVHATGLTFDYGGVGVLHGVDLTVLPGEIVALTGANGSGKSTLLSLIAGLEQPRSGTLVRPAGSRVAVVFQATPVPETLPLTVEEVVAMGRWPSAGLWRPLGRRDRAIVDESIRDLGLAGIRSRSMIEVSGGQRQRAFVAQGLARRADLLLLDEPMTALDAETRAAVGSAVRAAAGRGAGVCLVTHDADAAALAHRVVRLEGGRVADVAAAGRE